MTPSPTSRLSTALVATAYLAAMAGASGIGYTGETLRAAELAGFIVLFPLASLLLGLVIGGRWALWLPLFLGTGGAALVWLGHALRRALQTAIGL